MVPVSQRNGQYGRSKQKKVRSLREDISAEPELPPLSPWTDAEAPTLFHDVGHISDCGIQNVKIHTSPSRKVTRQIARCISDYYLYLSESQDFSPHILLSDLAHIAELLKPVLHRDDDGRCVFDTAITNEQEEELLRLRQEIEESYTSIMTDVLSDKATRLLKVKPASYNILIENAFTELAEDIRAAQGTTPGDELNIHPGRWANLVPNLLGPGIDSIMRQLENAHTELQRFVYLELGNEKAKLWYLIWKNLKRVWVLFSERNSSFPTADYALESSFYQTKPIQALLESIVPLPDFLNPGLIENLVGYYCAFIDHHRHLRGVCSEQLRGWIPEQPISNEASAELIKQISSHTWEPKARPALQWAIIRFNHLTDGPVVVRRNGSSADDWEVEDLTKSPTCKTGAKPAAVEPSETRISAQNEFWHIKNSALQSADSILDFWNGKAQFTNSVKAYARLYYKKIYETKQFDTEIECNRVVLASCLFLACRTAGIPRSVGEVANLAETNTKELNRAFKQLEKFLSMTEGLSDIASCQETGSNDCYFRDTNNEEYDPETTASGQDEQKMLDIAQDHAAVLEQLAQKSFDYGGTEPQLGFPVGPPKPTASTRSLGSVKYPTPYGRNMTVAYDYVYHPFPENRAQEVAESRRIARDLRNPGIISGGARIEDCVNLPLPHVRPPGTYTGHKQKRFAGPYDYLKIIGEELVRLATRKPYPTRKLPEAPPKVTSRASCRLRTIMKEMDRKRKLQWGLRKESKTAKDRPIQDLRMRVTKPGRRSPIRSNVPQSRGITSMPVTKLRGGGAKGSRPMARPSPMRTRAKPRLVETDSENDETAIDNRNKELEEDFILEDSDYLKTVQPRPEPFPASTAESSQEEDNEAAEMHDSDEESNLKGVDEDRLEDFDAEKDLADVAPEAATSARRSRPAPRSRKPDGSFNGIWPRAPESPTPQPRTVRPSAATGPIGPTDADAIPVLQPLDPNGDVEPFIFHEDSLSPEHRRLSNEENDRPWDDAAEAAGARNPLQELRPDRRPAQTRRDAAGAPVPDYAPQSTQSSPGVDMPSCHPCPCIEGEWHHQCAGREKCSSAREFVRWYDNEVTEGRRPNPYGEMQRKGFGPYFARITPANQHRHVNGANELGGNINGRNDASGDDDHLDLRSESFSSGSSVPRTQHTRGPQDVFYGVLIANVRDDTLAEAVNALNAREASGLINMSRTNIDGNDYATLTEAREAMTALARILQMHGMRPLPTMFYDESYDSPEVHTVMGAPSEFTGIVINGQWHDSLDLAFQALQKMAEQGAREFRYAFFNDRYYRILEDAVQELRNVATRLDIGYRMERLPPPWPGVNAQRSGHIANAGKESRPNTAQQSGHNRPLTSQPPIQRHVRDYEAADVDEGQPNNNFGLDELLAWQARLPADEVGPEFQQSQQLPNSDGQPNERRGDQEELQREQQEDIQREQQANEQDMKIEQEEEDGVVNEEEEEQQAQRVKNTKKGGKKEDNKKSTRRPTDKMKNSDKGKTPQKPKKGADAELIDLTKVDSPTRTRTGRREGRQYQKRDDGKNNAKKAKGKQLKNTWPVNGKPNNDNYNDDSDNNHPDAAAPAKAGRRTIRDTAAAKTEPKAKPSAKAGAGAADKTGKDKGEAGVKTGKKRSHAEVDDNQEEEHMYAT